MRRRSACRRSAAALALGAALVGCGGDSATDAGSSPDIIASASTGPSTTDAPSSTNATLPRPDGDWSTKLIEEYGAFLDGDLDRNLTFLDAVDEAPEREVELFSNYLLAVSSALSDVLRGVPTVPTVSDAGVAAEAFLAALADRRDTLDEIVAELDGGDDSRYAEFRSMLAEDPSIDACFDLQAELDRAGLGLLRCIPGPEGEPPSSAAVGPPELDIGPDAATIDIEFAFDPGADVPTGTFDVVTGAEELGCGSGEWVDSDLSEDLVILTKELTCSEGERTGTIVVNQWQDGSAVWIVTAATGDFVDLVAGGTSTIDPSTTVEAWSGSFSLPE